MTEEHFSGYELPPPSLLTNPKKVDQPQLKKELKRQAEILEESLMSFGIEAKVGDINCGPTITSFEIHPAVGVKVQKITALENDIALNLQAKSIRIIAPIPGKAAVGIEIPSPHPQEVSFKEMLLMYQQNPRKFHVPIILGKSVSGDNVHERSGQDAPLFDCRSHRIRKIGLYQHDHHVDLDERSSR